MEKIEKTLCFGTALLYCTPCLNAMGDKAQGNNPKQYQENNQKERSFFDDCPEPNIYSYSLYACLENNSRQNLNDAVIYDDCELTYGATKELVSLQSKWAVVPTAPHANNIIDIHPLKLLSKFKHQD